MQMVPRICLALSAYLLTTMPLAAQAVIGYALADQPTTTSYSPSAETARNDGDGNVAIRRIATGRYGVTFPGISAGVTSGGNVQVSGVGGEANCKVQNWTTETANVLCFTADGKAVDSRFAVLRIASDAANDNLAYAWASQPTTTRYDAEAAYMHNPSGQKTQIDRFGVGDYQVAFTGWSTSSQNNHAQVTAYGSGSNRCQISSLGASVVRVRCFTTDGEAADSRFSVLMLRANSELEGSSFTWADQSRAADYSPRAAFAHNDAGGEINVRRTARGTYAVTFFDLAGRPSHAQVTTRTNDGRRCEIGGWRLAGGAVIVDVVCVDAAGAPIDSTYYVQVLAVADGSGGGGPTEATQFDFEDLPADTTPTTQYAARGLLFGAQTPRIDNDPQARSGSRVLRSARLTTEFHTAPLILETTSGKSKISFYAKAPGPSITGTLRGYDDTGALIATDGPKDVASSGFTTRFEVTASPAILRRVELQFSGIFVESIDDLELVGEAADELPTEAPTVRIDTPENLSIVTTSSATLAGEVSGEGLLSTARFELIRPVPQDSSVPPSNHFTTPLHGSGTTRTFSQPMQLGLGQQRIIVRVENQAGMTAESTVRVNYLPPEIAARVDELGASRLGPFRFGGFDGTCSYVVFARGAVAAQGGEAFLIQGGILNRWLSEKPLNGYPSIGCPTSEERIIEGDLAAAQDFEDVRLYADPEGSYLLPSVFADALDALGGEEVIGIPMEDPMRERAAVPRIEHYQRFRRPGRNDVEGSLELVNPDGLPPTLHVSRRANYPDFPIPGPSSPFIYEKFPCTSLTSCDFERPAEPKEPDIGRYCNHERFDWEGAADALLNFTLDLGVDVSPPEWVAIRGDYVQTPARGLIIENYVSSGDSPFTHENRQDCSIANPGAELADCLLWMAGMSGDLAPNANRCCPSDVHFNFEPLPGWRHLLGAGEGTDSNYDNEVAVEYELAHARAFTAFGAEPQLGDLVFAAGRWIVDCGHAFKTEIHPPSVLSFIRSTTYQDKPATVALVWVNGFYSGEPVELDIHPPPRPTPLSQLRVFTQEHPIKLEVVEERAFVENRYLRVRFTASPRQVEVTPAGEMKWQHGRSLKSKIYVYWE